MILFPIKNEANVPQEQTTHTVFCVDVSGSMWIDLPKLKQQLKNKIMQLISVHLFSLIYFSGRNDAGIIFKAYRTGNLSLVNATLLAIENLLNCIGLTAFKKPLELAASCIQENVLNRLVFMTDGYNNDVDFNSVMTTLKSIAPSFDEIVFVEYGNYADTAKINQMAAAVGAVVISCEEFDDLDATLGSYLEGKGAAKLQVLNVNTVSEEVLGINQDGKVINYTVDHEGNIYHSPDIKCFFTQVGGESRMEYMAMAVHSIQSFKFKNVATFLSKAGDTELIEKWRTSFGKQGIRAFVEFAELKLAEKVPFKFEAYQGIKYPSVMEILLQLAEGNNLLFPHLLNYKKMSKGKVQKEAEVDLSGAKTKSEITAKLEAHKEPTFVADDPNAGVPLNGLAFNSERANVSIRVTNQGKVVDIPENIFGITEIPSFTYRNLNIFKDGILHTKKLFVSLDMFTHDSLNIFDGLITPTEDPSVWCIHLDLCPIINPEELEELTSDEVVKLCFELQEIKAMNKVFKEEASDKVVKGAGSIEESEFLKSIGISPDGSFNPKMTTAKGTDVYMALVFDCKFAGLSSLPKTSEVLERVAQGKTLNLGQQLIHNSLKTMENLRKAGQEIIDSTSAAMQKSKRAKELVLANKVMSLIMSRGWFTDRVDFDDNEFEMNINGYEVKGKLILAEKPIEI